MKRLSIFLSLLVLAELLSGCGLVDLGKNLKTITPSKNIITEERPVSGFTGVELGSFGMVTITQGDSESLTIKGSDNLLPLITTTVKDGVLIITMEKNVVVNSMNQENLLTYTVTVKDLTSLTVSGLGAVEMNGLSTQSLKLLMSGAGAITLSKIAVEELELNVSGLGAIEVTGSANHEKTEISGAGEVKAGDLQCKTADVTISGLGTATVWVTDALTGDISGGGNVRYYGDPKTNTEKSGAGNFEALGSK